MPETTQASEYKVSPMRSFMIAGSLQEIDAAEAFLQRHLVRTYDKTERSVIGPNFNFFGASLCMELPEHWHLLVLENRSSSVVCDAEGAPRMDIIHDCGDPDSGKPAQYSVSLRPPRP